MIHWIMRLLGIAGVAVCIYMLLSHRKQVPNKIRYFSRNILNPVILNFAGYPRNPYAVLHHVGRRSGNPYTTPLLAQSFTYGFVIPLTYGDVTDWYRNIQAAGGCTIRWNGTEYATEKPERIDAPAALPMFPLAVRLVLQAFGIKQFVKIEHSQAAMNNRRG